MRKQWTKIKIMVNGSIIIAKLEQPVQPCSHIFLLCIFIIVMAIMILLSWWSLLETISSKLCNSNAYHYLLHRSKGTKLWSLCWKVKENTWSCWINLARWALRLPHIWSLGFQLNFVLFGTHLLPMQNILCNISLKKIVLIKDCGIASLAILKFEE